MRKLRFLAASLLLAAFIAAGLSEGALAQALIQASPTRLDAATSVAVGTNWNTVASQSTATATPPAGQFVYVTALYMSACQNSSGSATANANFTTTGLGGMEFAYSAAAAEGCAGQPGLITFATPQKSAAAGTAVTLVSPASTTNTGYGTEIFYYTAP